MIRNYIEFNYDEDGYIYAKISQDGKHRIIKNLDKIFELMDIAEKYGYTIEGEMRIVKDARFIINEFNHKNSKNKQKLKLFNKPNGNMKLKKTNPMGKKIAAISLATTMALVGVTIANSNQDNNIDDENVVKGQYITTNSNVDEYSNYLDHMNNIDHSETEPTTTKETYINQMVNDKNFHFSYEDRTSSENIDNVNQYDDIFQKYAKMYGLDVMLLKAIACQETGGDHYGNLGKGPAEGIMQIEKSVHLGETITGYNFETGENDYFEITSDNLQDIDFNIRVAAIDLRNAIEAFNYNIPQGTQAYNLGIGGMNQTLAICCRDIGEQQTNLENNPTNNSWLNYREAIGIGDPEYIEHVFSYIPNNTTLTVKDRTGANHTITIKNDYQKQTTR